MQGTVKERLIAFIKYKGISQLYFQNKIGKSNGYIYSIVKGVSQEVLFRIKEEFPELNISWLTTGEGDMLNNTEKTEIVPKNAIPFFDVDFEGGRTRRNERYNQRSIRAFIRSEHNGRLYPVQA